MFSVEDEEGYTVFDEVNFGEGSTQFEDYVALIRSGGEVAATKSG